MNNKVLVSTAMPNEKDLEVMKETVKMLESFGIPVEVVVTSAHRSRRNNLICEGDERESYRVIIAAASGAAHLPGMIAAFTTLPVMSILYP
jgi:phosphoribosylaminoimidazole carboxylase PurE protein